MMLLLLLLLPVLLLPSPMVLRANDESGRWVDGCMRLTFDSDVLQTVR